METRSGSLQVTKANAPARFDTTKCDAFNTFFSSGSIAKSFVNSSLDVLHAMDTERSTTGWIISRIALSTATGTTRFRAGCWANKPRFELIFIYAAKFGITVSAGIGLGGGTTDGTVLRLK